MNEHRFTPPKSKRRPPDRQNEIVEYFRRRILDGQLRLGDRLPGRIEIKEQFGVSYLTVQRAFDRLIGCGFVVSTASKGTFVSQTLPHLSRFALAMPQNKSSDGRWNRFYEALEKAAAELSTSDLTVEVYDGVEGKGVAAGYAKLLRDVEHRSVAGLIFPSSPWTLEDSSLFAASKALKLPMTAIGDTKGRWGRPGPGMGGMADFLDKAAKRLASLRCSRVACLSSIYLDASVVLEPLRAKLVANGIAFERKLVQAGQIGAPEWNRGLIRLLLDGPPETRPDGLIILDDNIAGEVFGEIAAMGRRVPDDLRIVSHCNFPLEEKTPFHVDFLGYDTRKLLEKSLRIVQAQTPSAAKPAVVKAVFEDEL